MNLHQIDFKMLEIMFILYYSTNHSTYLALIDMYKKKITLTNEIKEYHDPLAYVQKSPDSLFLEKLGKGEVIYEYNATSDGYIAVKYVYTKTGDHLTIHSVEPFTNIRTLKLHHIGSRQYRTKHLGVSNFIDKLEVGTIIVSYSHDIKNPMVEKLLELNSPGRFFVGESFDSNLFIDSLKVSGTNRLPKNVNEKNFRKIIIDQISSVLNGKTLVKLLLRDVQKFGGNNVNINLGKTSFVKQLQGIEIGFIEYLKSFNLSVVFD